MKRLLALGLTLTLALTLMAPSALGAEEGDLSITWMPGYRLDTDYVVSSAGTVMAVEEATGLMGVLDAQGNVVTPFTYQSLMGYRGRRDFVEILDGGGEGGMHLIDAQGNRVDLPYDFIPDFYGGLSAVIDPETGNKGFINQQFELVIPCVYWGFDDYFPEAEDGCVVIYKDGLGNGLLDKAGNFTIPAGWDGVEARTSDAQYLVVTKGEEQALIQRGTGRVVIQPGTYDSIEPQKSESGDYLVVRKRTATPDGNSTTLIGVADLEGNVVVPVEYTDLWLWEANYIYSGTCFVVTKETGSGLLDFTGKELLPCEYYIDKGGHMHATGPYIQDVLHQLNPDVPEYVWPTRMNYSDGLASFSETGPDGGEKYGFRDEAGAVVVPPVFDAVSTMSHGYAMVVKDGVSGLLKNPLKADVVSDWAKDEVAAAQDRGLITPLTGQYRTYPITRLQFAELAVNLVETATGSDVAPAPADRFADTTDPVALKAAQAGIVNGTGDGTTFSPEAFITREEIAAMLYRAELYLYRERDGLGFTPAPLDPTAYSDGDQISPWAAEAMGHLVNRGIMNGTSDTTLSPKAYTTVEQGILLILRASEGDPA